MIIAFQDGSIKPAFAAYMDARRVRAFVPGCDDVVEFNLEGDCWLDEDGRAATIRFGVPDDEFHSLVWNSAQGCDSPSDALQVYLLSLISPAAAAASACERVHYVN